MLGFPHLYLEFASLAGVCAGATVGRPVCRAGDVFARSGAWVGLAVGLAALVQSAKSTFL